MQAHPMQASRQGCTQLQLHRDQGISCPPLIIRPQEGRVLSHTALTNRRAHRTSVRASLGSSSSSSADVPSWLQSVGGSVCTGIGLQGRTLHATQVLDEDSVLIRVPEASQIRYDTIDDPKLHRLFSKLPSAEQGDGLSPAWQAKQALTVLWHLARGEASHFHTQFHNLPGLAPGVPVPCVGMYLQDELLAELQDETLIKSVLNHRYWWKEVWKNDLQGLAGTEEDPFCGMEVTLDMFGWAIAVSLSRCFGIKSINTHVMTPLIDMADHSFDSNCAIRRDPDDASISMFAKHKIDEGTPLTLSYGPHSHAQQLLSYGFLSADNPHNIFSLAFDSAMFLDIIKQFGGEVAPLADWQMQALERLGLQHTPLSPPPTSEEAAGTDASRPSATSNNSSAQGPPSTSRLVSPELMYLKAHGMPPVDPRLLAGLRVMLLGEDERFLIQLTPPTAWGAWSAPISQQNEIKVMKGLSAIITAFYKSFPTTIQEDKRLLAGLQELSSQQQSRDDIAPPFQPPGNIPAYTLALQYRLSLKQSLEKGLINVRARLKELAG